MSETTATCRTDDDPTIMSDVDGDGDDAGPDSDSVLSVETADDSLVEVVHAVGHENVTAEHASTVEFTTDDWLTSAGDCIIGIEADRTPRNFAPEFREACQDAGATITATIVVDSGDGKVDDDGEADGDGKPDRNDPEHVDTIVGRGDPDLTLLDGRSMVGRTSDYTDDERTIFVDADGAAADLDRDLVDALVDGADVTLRLEVEPGK